MFKLFIETCYCILMLHPLKRRLGGKIHVACVHLYECNLNCSFQNGVFGVSLGSNQRCCVVQCGSRSVTVPKFLADAIEFLEGYLTVEGLFRKAGSLTRQREIKVCKL